MSNYMSLYVKCKRMYVNVIGTNENFLGKCLGTAEKASENEFKLCLQFMSNY